MCQNVLFGPLYRECGSPPSIFADSQAEGQYLDLDQLGSVFNYLSGMLPGMFRVFWN